MQSSGGRPFLILLQTAVGLGLGVFSLFFIGPETKRADASASFLQQIAAVTVVAGAYSAIGWIGTRDIRWSSVLAVCLTIPSTPVFAFLWLMSGWSMPSAEAGKPLILYIAGNIVLFLSALWTLIEFVNKQAWRNTR